MFPQHEQVQTNNVWLVSVRISASSSWFLSVSVTWLCLHVPTSGTSSYHLLLEHKVYRTQELYLSFIEDPWNTRIAILNKSTIRKLNIKMWPLNVHFSSLDTVRFLGVFAYAHVESVWHPAWDKREADTEGGGERGNLHLHMEEVFRSLSPSLSLPPSRSLLIG